MVRRQQGADRAIRPKLRSPGHPKFQRHIEAAFWDEIAKGLLAEEAAGVIGVAPAVATRWFRQCGGMRPFDPKPNSGRYLSFSEREEIALLNAQGMGVREIARQVGRDPGTISRELRRNAATRGGKLDYRASVAQWKSDMAARRPKASKLVANPRLHAYVQKRLSGEISTPGGRAIAGPSTGTWTGRNKPHRKDRAWVQAWSPEQIANRIKFDFPDDESMRISHEAIYQALYIQGRGALKRELILCLRTGRALRAPRARSRRKTWAHVTPEALISERPAEVEDRAVPGHWEGDLIIGLERSAIGTVVERSTRFTMLVHLPREEGYRHKQSVKNGPALAGYGAITMKAALANTMSTLPEQLARSLTWDRGKEMSAHAQFRVETGIPVFFADPHSPWQRGTNENTNGLLRQYFPKGTDLSRWSAEEVEAVAHTLNSRPRKTLGWKTPAEAFNEQLQLLQQAGVATTG
ncbi:IS30 family transposase [Streptomyces sp. NBC_01619]|uniref:IS30 family transposase n=1 Tax=Streptomyces sp. NBC_01619 TaxID=2975901 RepID=UPI00225C3950|nr:IS30 family transposase [Streptomyces sp. NBC_01619]MCX4515713.1 IS30 family transposase [Streptomyces sp. NBC_01619]MCX4515854.1 IS30 family transposase [Streptomyces sp. NBC_01619]